MKDFYDYPKGTPLEDIKSDFKVFINPLVIEAISRKMFLYHEGFGDWRAPEKLLNNPTMFDLTSPETWEIRDIKERIQELEEKKKEIEEDIQELSNLLCETYS